MPFYEYRGAVPAVQPGSFIHPQASIIGNVAIGKNVYIGPFASLRGDFGNILIKDGCNVQDSCTLHMFPGVTVVLEENAHIGHGAIIHGAHIGRNVLVGMHAVVMDDVEVGDESIIGALSFVPAGMKIPPRSVVAGNPAKIIKQVSDEMIQWKTRGTEMYQALAQNCIYELNDCKPETIQSFDNFEFKKLYDKEDYAPKNKTRASS